MWISVEDLPMAVIVGVPVLVIMVEVEEGVEVVEDAVGVQGGVVDGQGEGPTGTTVPFSAQIYTVHMTPSCITATAFPTSYLVPLMTQGHAARKSFCMQFFY